MIENCVESSHVHESFIVDIVDMLAILLVGVRLLTGLDHVNFRKSRRRLILLYAAYRAEGEYTTMRRSSSISWG